MTIKPVCHRCGGESVRKHGFARSKLQRYFCYGCNKTFQNRYIYSVYKESSVRLIKSL